MAVRDADLLRGHRRRPVRPHVPARRRPAVRKRADFLVNVTNDGWFMANENSQHLQAAVFRSIENRAPTARSVNTGISGFVDPLGRAEGLIPARTGQHEPDRRLHARRPGDAVHPHGTAVRRDVLCGVADWWRRWHR